MENNGWGLDLWDDKSEVARALRKATKGGSPSNKSRVWKKRLLKGLDDAGHFIGKHSPETVIALSAAVSAMAWLWRGATAEAATYNWTGGTSADMSAGTNWGGTAPTTLDVGQFNSATYTNAPSAVSSMSIGELVFGSASTNPLTFGAGTGTLTLYGISGIGIQLDSGTGAVNTGSAKFALGANQTWLNNSSLTVGGTITNAGNVTPFALTVDGSGNTSLTGIISNGGTLGTTGIIKTGAGSLTLGAVTNSFTGGLVIKQGTVNSGNSSNSLGGNTNIITIGDNTLGQNATLNISNGSRAYVNPFVIAAGSGTRTISSSYTSGTTSMSGAVTLNNSLLINGGVGNVGAFVFSGAFTGTGDLTLKTNSTAGGGLTVQTGGLNMVGSITSSGAGTAVTAISAVIGSNVTGLTQNSASSVLNLSGTQNYSAPTTVSAGTLSLLTTTAKSANSTITVANGATLSLSMVGTGAFTATDITNLFANSMTKVSMGATAAAGIDVTNGNYTFTNTIGSSTRGLSKLGTNTLTMTGTGHAYTGATTIVAGTLQLGDGTVGHDATISGTSGLTNNGALVFNYAGNQTAAYNILGTGSVTTNGTGVLTLSGTNSYAGATLINAGTLKLGSSTALGTTSSMSLGAAATFDLGGNSETIGALSTAVGTITDSSAAGSGGLLTISGSVGGGNATLFTGSAGVAMWNNNGSAFLTNSANTYSGGTTLGIGNASRARWAPTGSTTVGTGTPGALTSGILGTGPIIIGATATDTGQIYFNAANVTINNAIIYNSTAGTDITGSTRIDTTGHVLAGVQTANLSDVYLRNNGGTGGITVTGQITGSNGLSVAAVGTLTVTLSNTSLANPNNYNGDTFIYDKQSTLVLGASNQIPNGAGKGNLNTNTTGIFNMGGFSETINGLTGAGTVDGVSGTPVLTLGDGDTTATFSGVIKNSSGTLTLTKIGTGTQTLTGANTYTGKTTVSAGTLSFSTIGNVGAGSSALGAPTTAANGTIDLNGGLTYTGGAASSDRVINLTGVSVISNSGSGTLTLSGGVTGSSNITFRGTQNISESGLIAIGAGSVTHTDPGTLFLTNTGNSFTGFVQVSTGTISVASIANSGVNSTLGAGSQIRLGQNFSSTTGIGTLQFTGASGGSSNRAILINNGAAGGAGVIENTIGGQTLTLSGDVTAASTSSTSSLTLQGAGNGVLSGSITGSPSMSLIKAGTGTWTMSGTNTYTGTTTVSTGTLNIQNANALGSTAGGTTVANTGLLQLQGGISYAAEPLTLTGGGGGNTLLQSVSGNNTWNGTITTTAGAIVRVEATANQLTLAGDITTSTTASDQLVLQGAGNIVVSGNISGVGGVTGSSTGTGTRTLSGINTYTGTTSVNGSTLALAGGSAIADTGAVTVANTAGAVLQLNTSETIGSLSGGGTTGGIVNLQSNTLTLSGESSGTFAGSIIGTGGGLVKEGTGTLTISGSNNTYSGTTTINAGTLEAAVTGSLSGYNSAGKVVVNDGGTVSVQAGTSNWTDAAINTLLSNGTFAAGSNLGINVAGTASFTKSTAISGTQGLVKLGTNVLILGAANTYAGDTTVSAGTLKAGIANALPYGGAAGNITVSSGATLDLNGNSININGLSGSGSVNNLAGTNTYTLTVGNNDQSSTFSGVMSNTAGKIALTKVGTGTLTLSANNTNTGATTISDGTLALQGTYGTTSFNIASGAVLELNAPSAGTNTYTTATFSGTGSIRKTGSGTVVWGGVGTFALSAGGLIDVQGGIFTGGSGANEVWTNNFADLNIADGARFNTVEANVRVDALTGSGTLSTGYNGSGYANFTMGVAGGSGTFSGALVNGSSVGNIVKAGSGTQILSGTANTYTGTTTVSGGTLVISGKNTTSSIIISGGTNSAVTITDAAGSGSGAFAFNTGATTPFLNLHIDGGGTITLPNALSGNSSITTTIDVDNNGSGINGVIVLNGALSSSAYGAATLNVTGGNGYSLSIANIRNTGGSAGTTTFNPTTAALSLGNLTGAQASGTNTWVLGGTNDNNTVTGVISNASAGALSAVTKSGDGTWTLSNANTYTGATSVTAGALNITGSLGNTAIGVSSSGTLSLQAAGAVSQNTVTVSGTGLVVETVDDAISGSTTLVLNGGTMNLSKANSFTGATSLNAATLILGNNNSLVNSGQISINGAGVIQAGAANISTDVPVNFGSSWSVSGTNSLTFTGMLTSYGTANVLTNNMSGGSLTVTNINLSNNTVTHTLTISGGGNTTVNGVIADGGGSTGSGLTFSGTGTLALNGANTYSGLTTIAAGTLRANNADAIPAGGLIKFTGGILQFTSATAGIDYSSQIQNSTGAIKFNTNGLTVTINGVLDSTNTGGLAKSGSGNLILNNANTFGGNVTVSGGSLTITNSDALGSTIGGIATISGGQLHLNGSGGDLVLPFRTSFMTSNASNAIVNDAGDNEIQGNITLTSGAGDTAILSNAGTLKLSTYGGISLAAGQTARNLILGGGSDGTVFGAITANGSTHTLGLVKQGSGTWTLLGNNTYDGGTTISAGVLQVGNGGTTTVSLGTGPVVNNASLTFNSGSLLTVSGAITGSGSLVQAGLGTLSLTATNSTYTGGTIVSSGTLQASNVGALPGYSTAGKLTVATGATLAVNVGGSGEWTTSQINSMNVSGFDAGSSLGINTANAVGGSFTFSTALAGDLGLTKLGGNTLVVSGASTYTGPTTIVSGTLQASKIDLVGNPSSLGSGSQLIIGALGTSGTLRYTGNGGITDRDITLTPGGIATIQLDTASSATLTLSGSIGGTGTFVKSGPGTLVITGNSGGVNGGPVNITGGTLRLSGQSAILPTPGVVSLSGGATLEVDSSGELSSYAVSRIGNTLNLAGGSSVLITGSANGNTADLFAPIVLSSPGLVTLTVNPGGANTSTLEFEGITQGSPGSMVLFQGANLGNESVGGAALFTISLNSQPGLASAGAILSFGANPGGQYSIPIIPFAMGNDGTGMSLVTLGYDGTQYVVQPLTASQYADTFSDGAGSIDGDFQNVNLASTVTLTTVGATATTVNSLTMSNGGIVDGGGSLRINSGLVMATGTGTIGVAGSALYTGQTGTDYAPYYFPTGSDYYFNVLGGAALTVNSDLLGSTFSGTAVNVSKFGSGTLVLTGTGSSYSGLLTIGEGTLQVSALNNVGTTGPLGTGSTAVNLGATGSNGILAYDGASVSNNRSYALATGGTGTFQIIAGTSTLTLSGAISGGGTLGKTGAGTLTLNTLSNTYTGGTVVNEGTLNIDVQGNSTQSAVVPARRVTVNSGAMLRLNKTDGLGYYGANPNTLTINGGTMTIAAGIHASVGNFGITLNGGTIAAEGAGDSGGNYIFDGTITTLANANSSVISAPKVLLRNGNITNGSVTFNVADGAAATDLLVSSVLGNGSGVNGLIKTGSGTMLLTSVSSYTGATTINGGTLELRTSGTVANIYTGDTISINNGSTLSISSGGTGSGTQYWFNGKTMAFGSTGGGSIISDAGLNWVNGTGGGITFQTTGGAQNTISGSGGFNLNAQTATFTIARGTDLTSDLVVSTVVSNSGGVIKTGNGILTFSAANSYGGPTTVREGTMILSGARTAASGLITVADTAATNATLNITNGTYALGANSFIVGSGASATGTVNQSAGIVSFTSGNGLLVGNLTGNGVYNLSGGTLTSFASTTRGVIIGVNAGASGTFNLSGTGNLSLASSILEVGRSDSGASSTTNLFNQTGGTATVGTLAIGGNGSTSTSIISTMTLTGGTFTATTFSKLANGDSDVAVVNIGGSATVTLPAFPTARGAGATATVNFDGGTLIPGAASTGYMGGLTNAFIKAGGATFSVPTGRDITITQNLLTDAVSTGGGLTKADVGKLTLSGTNTYTGLTTVGSGTLALASAGTIANSSGILVKGGATLDLTAKTTGYSLSSGQTLSGGGTVSLATTTQTLTIVSGSRLTPSGDSGTGVGTLTLSGTGAKLTLASGSTTTIALGTPGTSHASVGTSSLVALPGVLTLGGVLNLSNTGTAGAGSYAIFTQSGTATGAFSSINNIGTTHAKVDTATSGSVFLDVYRLASAGLTPTGLTQNYHTGDTVTPTALTITNTAANDGYSEKLNASFGTSTAVVTTSGSVNLLAAGSSTGAMTLTVNTSTAGDKSGTVGINFQSDGTGTSGYGTTTLTSQSVTVASKVYNYAVGSIATGPFTLRAHQGGSASQTLTISNVAPVNATYTETLLASFGTASSPLTVSGSVTGLAGGATNSSSLLVSLNTATAQTATATAVVNYTSQGLAGSGFGDTSRGSQAVTVNATVYSGQATWKGTSSATWNNFGNWDALGGVPGIDGALSRANDTATFDSTGAARSTVTLDGTSPELKAVTFNSATAYTLNAGTGGMLKFDNGTATATLTGSAGSHTINVPISLASNLTSSVTAGTITVSGNIGESATGKSLSKTGAGSLVLSGANSFSGGVSVSGGQLWAQSASALGASGTAVSVAGGSSLLLRGGGSYNNYALTIAGTGDTSNGAVRSSLGTNTWQGTVTLSGDATIASASSTNLTLAGDVELNNSGAGTRTLTLNADTTGPMLISGVIKNTSGSGALTKTGTGMVTLTAANTYTGTTSINGGTLALSGGNNRLATTGTLVFGGGNGSSATLNIGSNTQTLSSITIPSGVTTSMTATITGNGGSLTVNGAADLNLGPTYVSGTPATTINMAGLTNFTYNASGNAFRVAFNPVNTTEGSSGTTTASTVILATGSNTITAASFNIGDQAGGSGGGLSTVHLGTTNTLNVGNINMGNTGRASAVLDFASGLTNPTLKVRNTDGTSAVASWAVGSVNTFSSTTWTQSVDVSAGTLDALVTTMTIGSAATNTNQTGRAGIDNASFTMGATTGAGLTVSSLNLGQITGSLTNGALAGSTIAANGTFTMNNAAGTLNVGTITFATNTIADTQPTAIKTVSGTFNLTNGTVKATTIQLGSQTGTATATAAFNWTNGTIQNTDSANLSISGVPISLLSGTHTFDASGSNTITVNSSSVISGVGGLTKNGSGTLTLSGANSFAGNVTVNAGTMKLTNSSAMGTGSKTFTMQGTGRVLQLSNNITLGNNISYFVSSNSFDGGGINNLDGTNEIQGQVNISTGNAALNIASAAGALTVSGNVTATSTGRSLYLGGASTNANTISGIISDGSTAGLPVTKQGAGTWVLSGANSYTGATTINGGKLIVNGSLAAGSAVTINSGTLSGSGTIGGSITVNSGGILSPGNSPGTLSSGAETWFGGGKYVWEIDNVNGTLGSDSPSGGWDFMNISGTLDLSNLNNSNKFVLDLRGLDHATHTTGSVAGWSGGAVVQSWTIATASGGITNFSTGSFTLDTSSFGNTIIGSGFSLSQVGNNLVLNYVGDNSVFDPTPNPLTLNVLQGTIGSGSVTLTNNGTTPGGYTTTGSLVISGGSGSNIAAGGTATLGVSTGTLGTSGSNVSVGTVGITSTGNNNTMLTVNANVYQPFSAGLSSTGTSVLLSNATTSTLRANAQLQGLTSQNSDFGVSGLPTGTTIVSAGGAAAGTASLTSLANKLNGIHQSLLTATVGYDSNQGIQNAAGTVTLTTIASQTVSGNIAPISRANDKDTFGIQQTARLVGGASYAGFSSTVDNTSTVSGIGGAAVLGTTASLLSGTAGADMQLTMEWRTRTTGARSEVSGSATQPPFDPVFSTVGLASDVVNIGGTGSDTFVLQMSYNEQELAKILGFGTIIDSGPNANRSAWDIFETTQANLHHVGIGSLTGSDLWVLQGGGDNLGSWQNIAADIQLGVWGVDTNSNVAWVVVDHGGQFAVVPEPGSLSLLGLGALGLLGSRRRRRSGHRVGA